MLTPTVYLDTSVINFLFATDAPELQLTTVDFFEQYIQRGKYTAVVSDFVVQELTQTRDQAQRTQLLEVLTKYPIELLPTTDIAATTHLASLYLQAGALPPKKLLDALHVAFCVTAQIPYLVSWNYKHLANVERERRITAVNLEQGYFYPTRILTPFELFTDED